MISIFEHPHLSHILVPVELLQDIINDILSSEPCLIMKYVKIK